MAAEPLQKFFDGLYSALTQAQTTVEEAASQRVRENYFDEDGKPKTVKLNLGGREVEAALFTLIPHNSLKIEECEVNLELNLAQDGKECFGCLGKLRKAKMANIRIKFSSTDQAEGLARVGDSLIKLIPTT